ncbi:hypothetical protein DI005_20250 [Prauserella sp. PE36]|uniref:hypothetical protein n=1 Tax=Prauserella sp. PE36 TaxID=1504709 RepID=UPI000DE26A11|nr:hypothetical protein [Prauserella sp. PE36]RBM18127.1 hypothetical protein DI005_20250 [Prauserella sp. PE36]
MTAQLDHPRTEFPTLDLAELDQAPLRPAIYLRTVEHHGFPRALACMLPSVVHAVRHVAGGHDEHEFIDTRDGAAVRLVLRMDVHTHEVRAQVAESGPFGLWDRIVVAASTWDREGRPQD